MTRKSLIADAIPPNVARQGRAGKRATIAAKQHWRLEESPPWLRASVLRRPSGIGPEISLKPKSMDITPGRAAIEQTYALILPHIRVTPVLHTGGAGFGGPATLLPLKLELLQRAGSFKARGAFANLLLRRVPEAGVVAASGGNHGVAVALCRAPAGRARQDLSAHHLGAREGRDHPGARRRAGGRRRPVRRCAGRRAGLAGLPLRCAGRACVRPAGDAVGCLGTLGLELAEQAPELDTVLVLVGGGVG